MKAQEYYLLTPEALWGFSSKILNCEQLPHNLYNILLSSKINYLLADDLKYKQIIKDKQLSDTV